MAMLELVVSLLIVYQAVVLAAVNDDQNVALQECESTSEDIFHTDCDSIHLDSFPDCGPGQMLANECVTDASKACKSCPQGSYQRYHNHCLNCHRCTVCKDHQRTVETCTDVSDTVCEDVKPFPEVSPRTTPPSSPTASDSAQTVPDPSSQGPTEPADTAHPPSQTTLVDATSGNASPGELPSIANPTAATTEAVKHEEGAASPQDDTSVVVALALTVAILATLLVISTIGCFYYRHKSMERTERHRPRNIPDPEGGQRYSDLCARDDIHGPGTPPPSPGTPPPCPDIQCAGDARPNGFGDFGPQIHAPSPADEPIYAKVDKQRKAEKGKSADPKTKASDERERNPVCKLLRKARKGRHSGKKTMQEPGSSAEKGSLMPSSPGSTGEEKPCQPLKSASASADLMLPDRREGEILRMEPLSTAPPPSSPPLSSSLTPSPSPPASTSQRDGALGEPPPRCSVIPTPLPSSQLVLSKCSRAQPTTHPSSSQRPRPVSSSSSMLRPPPSTAQATLPHLSHPSSTKLSSAGPQSTSSAQASSSSLVTLQPSKPTSSSREARPQSSSRPASQPTSTSSSSSSSSSSPPLPHISQSTPPGTSSSLQPPPPPPLPQSSPPSSSSASLSSCAQDGHLDQSCLPSNDEGECSDDGDATKSKQVPEAQRSSQSPASVLQEHGTGLAAEGDEDGDAKDEEDGDDEDGDGEEEENGDEGRENGEEMDRQLINPETVVTEGVLDRVPYEVSLENIESIARKLGQPQNDIDNIKQSNRFQNAKTIGFHILRDALNDQGRALTYRRLLVAIRDCGQKNAADHLIAEFGIDLELERR